MIKIAASTFLMISSTLAFADPYYLSAFEGVYRVSSRKCSQADSICLSTVTVELQKSADGSFFLKEKDQSGKVTERRLTETTSTVDDSTIRGITNGNIQTGGWFYTHKNSANKFDRTETISFSYDFTSDDGPVSFSDAVTEFGSNNNGSATKTRAYTLQK